MLKWVGLLLTILVVAVTLLRPDRSGSPVTSQAAAELHPETGGALPPMLSAPALREAIADTPAAAPSALVESDDAPRTGSVIGYLMDAKGDRLPRRMITASNGTREVTATANADGRFDLRGLEPGTWQVAALGSGPSAQRSGRTAIGSVEVGTATVERSFYLPGHFAVQGNFILSDVEGLTLDIALLSQHSGATIARATAANLDPLRAEPEAERPPMSDRKLEERPGFVRFEGVPEGLYFLDISVATKGQKLPPERRELEVREDLNLDAIVLTLRDFGIVADLSKLKKPKH